MSSDYTQNGEYKNWGRVWLHADSTSLTGTIYGHAMVAREVARESDNQPLYRIYLPGDESHDLGALWEREAKSNGKVYLSGKFGPTKETQRHIKLWPADPKTEKHPVLRVMPAPDDEEFDRASWDAEWEKIQPAAKPTGGVPRWRQQQAAPEEEMDLSAEVPF